MYKQGLYLKNNKMLIFQRNRDLLAASRYSALPSIVRLQQKTDVHGQSGQWQKKTVASDASCHSESLCLQMSRCRKIKSLTRRSLKVEMRRPGTTPT